MTTHVTFLCVSRDYYASHVISRQDSKNCPFFLKTGACRFGDTCSRHHYHPQSSTTLLVPGMYASLGLQEWGMDDRDDSALEVSVLSECILCTYGSLSPSLPPFLPPSLPPSLPPFPSLSGCPYRVNPLCKIRIKTTYTCTEYHFCLLKASLKEQGNFTLQL